jgi:hypothetical protein
MDERLGLRRLPSVTQYWIGVLMKEQRHLPALRAHIEQLLHQGWVITTRAPLKLRNGRQSLVVSHGMLISEGLF